MIVTVGVKVGNKKQICDDIAIINEKAINDDFYECETEKLRVIGVTDGVGGNSGGKDASSFVSKRLSQMDFTGMVDSLKEQLLSLNKELIEYADGTLDRKQMATTLTIMVTVESKYFLAHIGNTRMYVGQGAYLKQFTKDHTTYQWLLDHGQGETAELCNKNEISACLGGGDQRLANQMEVRKVFEEGLPNCIIFTSDGIHEFVEIDRLEEMIFAEKADRDIVNEVIQEAEKNGSEDDKTIVIVRK